MTTSAAAPDIDGLVFVEHLGTGGYSDVFLYERRAPRMKIAVKVLKEGRLSSSQLTQFAAEAETMAELADHPYIVQVFSTGATADGRPYLVMKYYPPPNLGIRCARERFSVADVLRTGVKIASAVETAHQAGILHRDIKPANILVSQYGEPGLTDFGIAGRVADNADDEDLGVSIPWSPPEVLSGESNGSAQADVYSLAATVWHLLVGRSPFELPGGDNSPRSLMARVLTGAPPATGRADVPTTLDRLLQQAMSKRASIRPRSALEFARSLQGIEQELRFARTEIVVGERGEPRPADRPVSAPPDAPRADATRLRAPSRVVAQPPARSRFSPPSSTPPAGPGDPMPAEPPTRARPARPAAPVRSSRTADADAPPATVLRPTRAGAGPAEPGTEPDPESQPESRPARKRGLKVKWAILSASGAVIAAVVVGVVLTAQPGSPAPAGDAGHTSAPPSQLAGFDPPEQPAVVAVRHGKKVTFTWTYGNPEKGDYYVWADRSGAAQHRVSEARVTRTGARGGVCVLVQVVRSNGQASLPSERVCS